MGMPGSTIVVEPIGPEQVEPAATFLHRNLNERVSAEQWRTLLDPPWGAVGPDRGVMLRDGDEIVGVYAAVYSQRPADAPLTCNLAAFCVDEPYRMHSLKLVRALLSRRELRFTDLSPSGNVVTMNERLGFRRLDVTTRLVANVPGLRPHGTRVTDDPARLGTVLAGRDAEIYRDHAATAARHALITRGDRYAYLIYRRDRRKRLPLFASPLYVGGERELLNESWGAVRAHLLRRGMPTVLAETRILGFEAGPGIALRAPRPKMVRGGDDPTDYAYSELTLLEW